jgi:hypothetical protein
MSRRALPSLPSLPLQTNRSTFADESMRLYTLISAIDRTNEKTSNLPHFRRLLFRLLKAAEEIPEIIHVFNKKSDAKSLCA